MKKKVWVWALVWTLLTGLALSAYGAEDTVQISGEKVLKAGESEVSYMTFSLADEEVAQKINADAKAQAQWLLSYYDLSKVTVKAECQALSVASGDMLSLRFAGSVEGEETEHPNAIYYTTNYSLATGERLKLMDICDPGGIVSALLGDASELNFEKDEQKDADYYAQQAAYLKDLGKNELTRILRSADSWTKDAPPPAFTYWNGQGTCTLSIEVPYALGEFAHITFAYAPEAKK